MDDGGDGRFDASDALYFFGVSPHDWRFSTTENRWVHYTNPYTNSNVYWLSWEALPTAAKRLTPETISDAGAETVTQGLRLQKIENDIVNLIRSGRNWYGRELSVGGEARTSYSFPLENPDPQAGGIVALRCVAETPGQHFVNLSLNGQHLGTLSWFGSSTYQGYVYVSRRQRAFAFSQGARSGTNEITLEYSSTSVFGSIRVDWIEFITSDVLTAQEKRLEFAMPPGNRTVSYQLQGFDREPMVLECSNPLAPRLLPVTAVSGAFQFTDRLADSTGRRYLAASDFLSPSRFELRTFPDLRNPNHAADMIILTHADFRDQAERLAEHKRNFAGFAVEVVDIADVFDEFGWGLPDPVAIRDFVAYAYAHWQITPRYLLLFGDGDYDYRNISGSSDKNWIPTFQTEDNDELDNRNIEAFFTYVSGSDRIMDLAVGRLPVRTPQEAQNVVDKIIAYESSPEEGFWRSVITMVADDELVRGGVGDETFHVLDADQIAENYIPDYFNVRKLYLMEYRGVRSASISGVRKPGANRDLIEQINQGTLVLNYVGHGNPQQWAHEVVFLQSQDFDRIDNGERLTFIVAATCDFGRFDMVDRQSFAEDLLNVAGRGVIGLLSSSRAVYANQNARFNRQYYLKLFSADLNSNPVGDALITTRMVTNNLINDEKYTILGDPSLRLLRADRWARISTISPDSLIALQKTTLMGETRSRNNGFLGDTGDLEVIVFDAPKNRVYTTARGSTVRYRLPGNLLFRGGGKIENGRFRIDFIVPKDITYGGDNARVSLFGFGDNWEALGYQEGLPISLRSSLVFDDEGPAIEIGFEGRENFISGDPVPQGARLIATIADSISGINVTGEIGHKITLTLDGDVENQLDLTRNFAYFPNNYLAGRLVAELPPLEFGPHTAVLKAWDNSNNSSRIAFDFVVTAADRLQISEAMNYPNPFRDRTAFTFFLNEEAEVRIYIYSLSGHKIHTLDGIFARPGYNQVNWDGRDAYGDRLANGIYLYKIIAKPVTDGVAGTAEFIGKLAVNRD